MPEPKNHLVNYPRPWKIDGHEIFDASGLRVIGSPDRALIAGIVHAVNSHDALVDALKDCQDILAFVINHVPTSDMVYEKLLEADVKARAALAAAEGK